MVNIARLLLPFLSSNFPAQVPLRPEYGSVPAKSIAIVGAGSAGLAMFKTLLDLPERAQEGWEVVLYEERENVGGVWLPDPRKVFPPEIPETPLYPLLHTNTPVPSMTYPGFPFPPKTPLYPSHEHIEAYHSRYAEHHNLSEIQSASWSGTPEQGQWDLIISDKTGRLHHKKFDHLVVASGNHHIPRITVWKGQDAWLSNTPAKRLRRRIVHSVYYREPEAFTNQSVVIVGNGASGRDAASQLVGIAGEVFFSIRHENRWDSDPIGGVHVKPEISHFTRAGVVFIDGTVVDPDVVLLGTGYELRKPPGQFSINQELVTNLRYIFPLHRHILSLSPSYPTNALAFIGLPTAIANCPSDTAQSLFVAHVILNPSILPSRAALLRELAAYEENIRAEGFDPYINGHKMLDGTSSDYQDELVDFLKEKVLQCFTSNETNLS
ncbi:hypothetical protein BDZ97DRAFT_1786402 [Flammula alnicola]|nr:hypothetical protein BDZ97DRAFT_1786402 [Flammula alnicola]